jgi:hypothetical protein
MMMIASARGRTFSDKERDFTIVFDTLSTPLAREAEVVNDLQSILPADDGTPLTGRGTKSQGPPSEGSVDQLESDAEVPSLARLDAQIAPSISQEPRTNPQTYPVFDAVDLGQWEDTSVPPITMRDTGTALSNNDIQFQTTVNTSHQNPAGSAQGSRSGNTTFDNPNGHSNGGQVVSSKPAANVSLHAVPKMTDTPAPQPAQTAGVPASVDGSSPKPLVHLPVEQSNASITPLQTPQNPLRDRRGSLEDTAHPSTFSKSARPMITPRPFAAMPQNVVHALQAMPSATFAPLDEETHFAARAEIFNAATAPQTQALQSGTHLSQHIARQIVEALQQVPNRPIEISLNPEELGRVRLAMSSTETGIVVNVLAERPETSDLMRRHIAGLEAAFRDIGYSDITFSFSDWDHAQDDTGAKASAENGNSLLSDPDQQTSATTRIEISSGPNAGLNIRL